jgi:class 3 adenylate cyclase
VIVDRYDAASILFADMAGFTARASDTKPDDLVHFLNRVFTDFGRLVESHGLKKIKTTGDSFMVVSCVPAARHAGCALVRAGGGSGGGQHEAAGIEDHHRALDNVTVVVGHAARTGTAGEQRRELRTVHHDRYGDDERPACGSGADGRHDFVNRRDVGDGRTDNDGRGIAGAAEADLQAALAAGDAVRVGTAGAAMRALCAVRNNGAAACLAGKLVGIQPQPGQLLPMARPVI